MQMRKIAFILVVLANIVPSNSFAIRLIGEFVTTQKNLMINEETTTLVQEKSNRELAAANVVNFLIPKPEELVSLIPNKTLTEIQIPKIPHITEKDIPITITTRGLARTVIGGLATVRKAYDKNFIAEIVNKKYGHYDLTKTSSIEKKQIGREVNKEIAKQWAYDIIKSHVVDKIYTFLEQKKYIPDFPQDTPEDKAKSLLMQYWIRQGIDMGLDMTANYFLKFVPKVSGQSGGVYAS